MKLGDLLIQKYNPYHDAKGWFTHSGNAHYVNIKIKRQNSGQSWNVGDMLLAAHKAKNEAAIKTNDVAEKIKRPRLEKDRQKLADEVLRGVDQSMMPAFGKENRLYQSFNQGLTILRSGHGAYKDDGQYNAVYQSVLRTKQKILDYQHQKRGKEWEKALDRLVEIGRNAA